MFKTVFFMTVLTNIFQRKITVETLVFVRVQESTNGGVIFFLMSLVVKEHHNILYLY